MDIARRRPALLLLGMLLAGCTQEAVDGFRGDPGDPARRVEEAEAQLRRLEEGRFQVDEFQPAGEVKLTFLDYYEHPTRVFALNFKAKAHCTRSFEVVSAAQLMHRQGEPGFSMVDFERDAELLRLLGEGEFIPGQKLPIEAAATFDALEPGYRFRLFDRPREATR